MKHTREDILKVARKAFATIGFQKTTIEGIARMANKGRRTIYTYFKNKSEIYSAVVELEIKEITGQLATVTGKGLSFFESLYQYACMRTDLLSDLLKRNPMIKRSFLGKQVRIVKLRDSLSTEEKIVIRNIIEHHYSRKTTAGNTDYTELASLFQWMLQSSDDLIAGDEDTDAINHHNKLLCSIFLKGIEQIN